VLHLIKMCVGVERPEQLAASQARRSAERREAGLDARPRHVTRNMPKRGEELLAGGSLYWVMGRQIRARQRIRAIEREAGDSGRRGAVLVLDPELVLTHPVPRRVFQGWRYLQPEDAPADLAAVGSGEEDLPLAYQMALHQLGLRPWTDSREQT